MKINRKFQSIVLCLFILFSGACVGLTGGFQLPGIEKPAADSQSAGADKPAAGSMLLADPRQGLDGLKSYHMQLVQEFTGEVDGNQVHTKLEHNGDVVRARQTEFVTLQQIEADGQVESYLTGVIGDASYQRTGDETKLCHITWNQEVKAAPSIWPVEMVPDFSSGEKTGEEEVNTVKTVHYKINEDSLGVSYFEGVSGDLWLSREAGYVVKLELNLTGAEKTFGKGRSGTKKLTYELTKINANDEFIAPAGCLPVLDGVPIMADAVREYRLPGNLRYYTPSSSEKVLAFYKEKLTTQGWQSGTVHETTTKGQAILYINPDTNEQLHLSLTPKKETTLVSVYVGKPPVVEQTPAGGELENVPTSTPVALDPANAGLPEGVTIYPEAKNFTGIPGLKLDFTTTDSEKQVLDYYKTSLVKEKWVILPGTGNAKGVPLMFKKNSTMLVIQVTEKDGVSQVEIMMVKQ